MCESAFRRLGVWDLFDAVALSSEVMVNKTNPDVYLLAAERIGVAPADCVVFEDIEGGIRGAKKAGMRTVAVRDRTNLHITQKLRQLADCYIDSWKELL